MRRSLQVMLAFFVALSLFGGSALAAKNVKVRAGVHKNFARIVFDWPGKVTYTTDLGASHLSIRFSEPFTADLSAVRRHLFRFVKDVTVSEDGQTLKMKLLKPMRLRDRRIDGFLAFDLVTKSNKAKQKKTAKKDTKSKPKILSGRKSSVADSAKRSPAPKPKKTARAKPKSLEKIQIRAGEHGKHSRLVFDWRRNVGYTVVLSKGGLSVAFARPATFDLTELQKDPPKYIHGAKSAVDKEGTRITLKTDDGVRFRHFRAGTKVVLDIYASKKSKKPKDELDSIGPAKRYPDKSLLRAAQDHGVAALAKLAMKAAKGGPKSLLAGKEKGIKKEDDKTKEMADTGLASLHDVDVEVNEKGEDLNLVFTWERSVPAVVFERSGYVWAVFGRRSEIDSSRLAGNDWISGANQIRNDHATVLRLKVRAGLFPVMKRQGSRWNLTLTPARGGPKTLLLPVAQPFHKNGPRVFVPAKDSARQVRIYDPEVGDELFTIPMLDSSAGVPISHAYVEFQILSTAQGLVIRPEIEDLVIRAARHGVIATTKDGLFLSALDANSEQAESTYSASMKRPVMHLYRWRGGRENNPEKFDEFRKQLLLRLASAPKAGRNKARWELAKYYLGQGLISAAGGVLQLMEERDSSAAKDPGFRAVRGLVHLFQNRVDEAETDLFNVNLRLYPDVALWRGSVLSRKGKFDEANRQFALGAAVLPDLPKLFRSRLFEDWAVAAAAVDDKASLHSVAQKWRRLESKPRVTTTLEYLAGDIAWREKDYEKAEKHFRAAIAADYRPYAARARLALIIAEREQEKIDREEAINRFERLRFAWRGDGLELDLVNRTVDMELEKKDYAAALGHLREAVSYFPKNKTTDEMSQRMKRTFVDLFLNGKADELSPVSSLALYFEFKELTPLGKQGDAMIQRLADRLADVDLLDRAARLLEHQVRYRLRGAEKIKVQTRLAVIYLLDSMPEKALKILRKGKTQNLSESLLAQRRYLQARALAEMDKIDEALALLAADTSPAAELLRAGIYWRGQRWASAAATTENLLGQRWRADENLSSIEQSQVVQLAVSYYMAGDGESLKGLNQRYGDKMAKGPHAETFRVLTHKVDQSQTKFRDLAGQIARVADLEAFMASYRNTVKNAGLSAIN